MAAESHLLMSIRQVIIELLIQNRHMLLQSFWHPQKMSFVLGFFASWRPFPFALGWTLVSKILRSSSLARVLHLQVTFHDFLVRRATSSSLFSLSPPFLYGPLVSKKCISCMPWLLHTAPPPQPRAVAPAAPPPSLIGTSAPAPAPPRG